MKKLLALLLSLSLLFSAFAMNVVAEEQTDDIVTQGDAVVLTEDTAAPVAEETVTDAAPELLEAEPAHPHSADSHGEYTGKTWTAWDGKAATIVGSDSYGISGYYYLTGNATMEKWIDVRSGQNIVICLNGYELTGPSGARMFRIAGGAKVTVCDCGKGGKLLPQFNAAGAVAGLYSEGGSAAGGFYMNGGTIQGKTSFANSLIYMGCATAVSLTDATLTGNKSANGGAINAAASGAVLNLTNTNITNCEATGDGGAIYASTAGVTIHITGGSISSNKAGSEGGALYINTKPSDTTKDNITIKNTTFTGNEANGGDNGGGAIFFREGKMTLEGVSIQGNKNRGKHGSAITYGVISNSVHSLVLKDCTITGNLNKTTDKRAAVSVVGNVPITVSGRTVIADNRNGTNDNWEGGTQCNLFLRNSAKLTVDALTDGANVQVTTDYAVGEDPDDFLSYTAATPVMLQENARRITHANVNKIVGYNTTDRFFYETIYTHKHAACACAIEGADCENHTAAAQPWSEWTSRNSLPTTAGYYYLTDNVTLSSQYAVSADVHICLNGFSIQKSSTAAAGGSMIYVNGGALQVMNCKATVENGRLTSSAGIKGCTAKNDLNAAGITLRSGSLALLGVEVSGHNHNTDGTDGWSAGALLARGTAADKLDIAYANFLDNQVSDPTLGSGGAINLRAGTANIRNCIFRNNTAVKNGGVIFMANKTGGVLNMTDCDITGNKTTGSNAVGGGAMFIGGGSASLTRVSITGNENTGNFGSAITFGSNNSDSAVLKLHDCTVTGNKSTNSSNVNKGGIAIFDGDYKLTLSGKTVIKDNTVAGGKECNIFLREATAKVILGQLSEGADIRITTSLHNVDTYGVSQPVADPDAFLTKGVSAAWDPAWKAGWITYENNGLAVNYSDAEVFYFDLSSDHVHCLCKADGAGCDHTDIAWLAWDKTDSLPSVSGNYYLTQDVQLTGAANISGTTQIRLCLNGKTVTASESGNSWFYSLNEDASLTIADCSAQYTAGTYTAGILTGGKDGAIRLRKTEGANGATLNLYDGILQENIRQYSGGAVLLLGNGTFNMYDGLITGNHSDTQGGGISVEDGSEANIYGGEIRENTAPLGAGSYVSKKSNLNLLGGKLAGNTASDMGGGVYVKDNGTVKLDGGVITENHAENGGGGIILFDSSVLDMISGYISVNTTPADGGGVYVANNATLNLSGGTIYDNEADSGAGIATHKATVNMTGGFVSTNKAATRGGGLYVKAETTANLSGGKLQGNTAGTWGGGICGDGRSGACVIKLSGTSVNNNEAIGQGGGGIFLENSLTLEMTGGAVASNKAKGDGGGIYVANNCKLNLSDGVISNNVASNGAGICTYKAEITMTGGTVSTNKSVTSAGGLLVQQSSKMTLSGGKIQYNNAGNIGGGMMVTKDSVLTMRGGTIQKNTAQKGGGGLFVTNQSSMTMTAGSIQYNTTPDDGGGLYVVNQSSMVFSGGTVSGNSAKSGGGIGVFKSVLTMNGGTVTGNKAKQNAGGVYVQTSSTMHFNGGSIIANSTENSGGGLYIYKDSSVKINGGSITKNTAKADGGGAVANTNSTLELIKGKISDNTAKEHSAGGVLILTDSAMVMSGGEVCNNSSALDGGGVYLYRRCTMEMTDGIISGNTCVGSGAGLKLHSSEATLSGGKITENVADNLGGGIHTSDESVLNLVGTQIVKNEAATSGGGIYATTKSKVTLDGSEICDNKGTALGGGMVIFAFTQLDMKSGTISNNTTGEKGGGLYINRGLVTIDGGEISNNRAGKGGGLYAQGDVPNYEGNVQVNDVTIRGNEALEGGGVGLYRIRSQWNGGVIEDNKADMGGGIHVTNSSVTDLGGITVADNEASGQGGGLWLIRGTVTTMTGTEVSGNKAGAEGGGVWADGILTLDGAKITKNTAGAEGGGVYLAAMDYDGESYISGMFKLAGDLVVWANDDTDLYICEGTYVHLNAEGLGSGAKVGVQLQSGLLTRTLIGVYGYEGGEGDYVVTAGDRSLTDPEKLPETDAPAAEQEAAQKNNSLLICIVLGVVALLIAAIILAIVLFKKKNKKASKA